MADVYVDSRRSLFTAVRSYWSPIPLTHVQSFHRQLRQSLDGANLDLAPWTQHPQWYTPLELYDILGPSARSCFWTGYQETKPQNGTSLNADVLHWELSKLLGDPMLFANANEFLKAINSGSMTQSNQRSCFHKFFFATPAVNPKRRVSYLKYEIPTVFLRLCIATHYRQYAKEAQVKLFGTMSPLAQVTAKLFKPLVLDLLVETDEGLGCKLWDKKTFRLGPGLAAHPYIVDPRSFKPPKTTFHPVDNRVYVVPEGYPSIDAFVVTEGTKRVTLLQMTIAQRHNLLTEGVQGVIQMFGEAAAGIQWSIVFVTPEQQGQSIA
ncbi:hypothetical protein L226DRAFT_574899, partial [Lentinus tigrinus ALCF2SS1-7]|uniref:uncharacterized protein n=1 Tax=Lentinus tigrinus ALCF2SS1-7 TaxID=1328758 RepID=UPI001165DBA6